MALTSKSNDELRRYDKLRDEARAAKLPHGRDAFGGDCYAFDGDHFWQVDEHTRTCVGCTHTEFLSAAHQEAFEDQAYGPGRFGPAVSAPAMAARPAEPARAGGGRLALLVLLVVVAAIVAAAVVGQR